MKALEFYSDTSAEILESDALLKGVNIKKSFCIFMFVYDTVFVSTKRSRLGDMRRENLCRTRHEILEGARQKQNYAILAIIMTNTMKLLSNSNVIYTKMVTTEYIGKLGRSHSYFVMNRAKNIRVGLLENILENIFSTIIRREFS